MNVDIETLRLEYEVNKLSLTEIARKYNYIESSLYSRFRRNGIKLEKRQWKKKYNPIDDFFKNHSHNMFYILGIIITDGCIYIPGHSPNTKILAFKHKDEDKELVEFCRDKICPEKPIRQESRKQWVFDVVSPQIFDDLVNLYGLMPAKTGKERVDFYVPDEYKPDLIRGLFDGDGTVKCAGDRISMSICSSSLDFINDVDKIVGIESSISTSHAGKHGRNVNLYSINYYGKNAIQFRDFIYNGNFSLSRKRELAFSYTDEKRSSRFKRWSQEDVDFAIQYYKDNIDSKPRYIIVEEIGKKLNRGANSVCNKLYKELNNAI